VTTLSVQAVSPFDQDPNTSNSFTQHTLAEACSRLCSACSDFILHLLRHELPDATHSCSLQWPQALCDLGIWYVIMPRPIVSSVTSRIVSESWYLLSARARKPSNIALHLASP
jgi:hypothetical protein